MFAKGDMPLKRIDEICRVLKCDFSELARKVADLELLREPIREWVAQHERDEGAQYLYKSWLDSGGELELVGLSARNDCG